VQLWHSEIQRTLLLADVEVTDTVLSKVIIRVREGQTNKHDTRIAE
jgi:hypothetical protein